jgi:hypothetical protein
MSENSAPPIEERTLGELVATVTRDLSLLLHKEIELAKTEIAGEVKRVGLSAGLLGAAGAMVGLAGLFLSVAAAFGISALGVSLGIGFVCVFGFYAIVAGGLATLGVLKLARLRKPERTIRTVQDNLAWARHPTVAPNRELEEVRARHSPS